MKYPSSILGVVAFVVAMVWSWNIIHSEATVSFETHSGIQEKLATLILETIKTKRASATDVHIDKLWTEVLSAQKMKAHFIYSFHEAGEAGPLTTTIKGEGFLERQAEDGTGLDHWSLTKVQTTSDAVVFEEGLVVTPDKTDISDKPEHKETK
jgi:hypothetical protein